MKQINNKAHIVWMFVWNSIHIKIVSMWPINYVRPCKSTGTQSTVSFITQLMVIQAWISSELPTNCISLVMWHEPNLFLLGLSVCTQYKHSHWQSAGTPLTGDLRTQLLVIPTQTSSELLIRDKIMFYQYKADNILQKCLIFQNHWTGSQ